ncbi:hypothetical protein MMC18_002508 [Xylographa bjoerkii]|nr:hypothetical protein [Xylographa bjoerkii]
MAPHSPKHKQLSPEAESAFMEFCGIRTFLRRVLNNETDPDDDVDAFFARLHEEIPFYIAYRFFPELRTADVTVDELPSEDRVLNPIFYDLLDIMQELMAEGLPRNPFTASVWAELKDALEVQETPVISDAMSEAGDPKVTNPLKLVPPTGKWSNKKQLDTDNAADHADFDVVKLMETRDRGVEGLAILPDQRQVTDNVEKNEQEESSKIQSVGTGINGTSDGEAANSSKVQLPKLEVTESGATAIALVSVEDQSGETPTQHACRSLLDNAAPVLPSKEPQSKDQSEQSTPKSLLDAAFPDSVPPNPPQTEPQSEIELLREHVLVLDLQLAHVQIERTSDNERMQALERQICDLHLAREHNNEVFPLRYSQRVVTESPFGEGRGLRSAARTERLGAGNYGPSIRNIFFGPPSNNPSITMFGAPRPVGRGAAGCSGTEAQQELGTEEQAQVEAEEEGDEV